MAVFKIGDRVRIVSQASHYHDQTGTITGVQRAPDDRREARESYVVELAGGQLEFFIDTDLERK